MEPQLLNPYGPRSNSFTNLLIDEIDPQSQPSSPNPQEFQENLLNISQRISISEENNPDSRPESLGRDRRKELSTSFSIFYNIILVGYMVISLWFLMGLMGIGDIPPPFDIFDFLAGGWTLAQALIAFSGIQEKSLKRMENALTMMKIYFLSTAIISLREGFEGLNFEVLASWIEKVFLTILIFFPTRNIRNILKSIPKEEELAYKEAQENNALKRLNSLPFTIYKYWLLIFCLVLAKWFILFIYGDFRTLKRFPSNHPEFISATMRIVLNTLRMTFSFNAFEGLRRRSLNKMEASIKIMKFCIATEQLLHIWRVFTLYGEGKLTIEENGGKWFILLRFLFRQLMVGLGNYLLFLYGASKARNILKADREAKRT